MLLLVAGVVLAAGCAGPDAPTEPAQAPSPPPAPPAPIVLTGDAFVVHAAGRVPQARSDAAWAGVLDTLNRYLDVAVVTPLRTGGPAGDLAPLLNRPALERVVPGGADRFAFIDENLPPVADLRSERAVAGLTALAGPDGTVSVVTAGIEVRLSGHAATGAVSVVRTGELVLMPEAGGWRIDAYDIKVVRTQARSTTTSTARS